MKASASNILNHPHLSNQQKAILLLVSFCELKIYSYETVCVNEHIWHAQDEITKAWGSLAPITQISGADILNAVNFHGYRVFMRDPSGLIFPVYDYESYLLDNNKIRVRSKANKEYDRNDLRCAAALMYGSSHGHKNIKGTKILLLGVNRLGFRAIYPTITTL